MLSAMDQWGVTQGGGGWVWINLALEKLSYSHLTAATEHQEFEKVPSFLKKHDEVT